MGSGEWGVVSREQGRTAGRMILGGLSVAMPLPEITASDYPLFTIH